MSDGSLTLERLFSEKYEDYSIEEQEKDMLKEILIHAVDAGKIRLPDRHTHATKVKIFDIVFERQDYKVLGSIGSRITTHVKEEEL